LTELYPDPLGELTALPQTPGCISVLPNSAVTVFNFVFTLRTLYDCCNASRSGFVYRGALNTLIVIVIVI